ncbi:hypothetical protein N308_01089, partial [Struthio camelus australis]
SVSVNLGHILISLIVKKKQANNPLPPSSCSELCTWLVKLMS